MDLALAALAVPISPVNLKTPKFLPLQPEFLPVHFPAQAALPHRGFKIFQSSSRIKLMLVIQDQIMKLRTEHLGSTICNIHLFVTSTTLIGMKSGCYL